LAVLMRSRAPAANFGLVIRPTPYSCVFWSAKCGASKSVVCCAAIVPLNLWGRDLPRPKQLEGKFTGILHQVDGLAIADWIRGSPKRRPRNRFMSARDQWRRDTERATASADVNKRGNRRLVRVLDCLGQLARTTHNGN
jgi:hypothetical protein